MAKITYTMTAALCCFVLSSGTVKAFRGASTQDATSTTQQAENTPVYTYANGTVIPPDVLAQLLKDPTTQVIDKTKSENEESEVQHSAGTESESTIPKVNTDENPDVAPIKTTSTQTETPVTQADTPATQADTPVTQANTPVTQADTPAIQTAVPTTADAGTPVGTTSAAPQTGGVGGIPPLGSSLPYGGGYAGGVPYGSGYFGGSPFGLFGGSSPYLQNFGFPSSQFYGGGGIPATFGYAPYSNIGLGGAIGGLGGFGGLNGLGSFYQSPFIMSTPQFGFGANLGTNFGYNLGAGLQNGFFAF